MHIRFATADAEFMRFAIECGLYTSETELVRDAVRRLREKHFTASPLFQAVMKGQKSISEGKTKPYSPELLEEIKKCATADAGSGKSYHSDDAVPY